MPANSTLVSVDIVSYTPAYHMCIEEPVWKL